MTENKKSGFTEIRLNQTVEELIKYGPSLEVGIAGLPYTGGGFITALAQIDTGASNTGMSPELMHKLSLVPAGEAKTLQPNKPPVISPFFRARLFFPSAEIDVKIVGMHSLSPPHDILIGRDLLRKCRLLVDFATGVTTLHIKLEP